MDEKKLNAMLDDYLNKEVTVEFGYPIHEIKRGTLDEMMRLMTEYSILFGNVEYNIIKDEE